MEWISPLFSASGCLEASGDVVSGQTLVITAFDGDDDLVSVAVNDVACIALPEGTLSDTGYVNTELNWFSALEPQLAQAGRVVLLFPDGEPYRPLVLEMARRIGYSRVFEAQWPADYATLCDVVASGGDTRDVFTDLPGIIAAAKPWPMDGLVTIADLRESVYRLYEEGESKGTSIGLGPEVDRYYTVRSGELTVVTGVPSHGKSSFIAYATLQMAKRVGWRFSYYSPENQPLERFVKQLVEINTARAFYQYGRNRTDRITREELDASLDFLEKHVSFIGPPPESESTLNTILELAKADVIRHGIKGLVIDPWNEIEHQRPPFMSETEYTSQALAKLKTFARVHGCHVWLIAHPTKMQRAKAGDAYAGQVAPPTPYDISGSANFYNKADACMAIWRDTNEDGSPSPDVELHIQKFRHSDAGGPGMIPLTFNRASSSYSVSFNDLDPVRAPRIQDDEVDLHRQALEAKTLLGTDAPTR